MSRPVFFFRAALFLFALTVAGCDSGSESLSGASDSGHTSPTETTRVANEAVLWSGFIEEARTRFAEADVYFGNHHWPLWGQENIQDLLITQRDTYKFIHDQSVRLMNQGATPRELAEQLQLPEALNQSFHNQGYYGTVSHNAKAVYQNYMGWFTANPSQLNPLPETDSAKGYMEMMGGAASVLEKARAASWTL